ncbi:phosphopantetheine-binding protein [Streptomyces sp. NRRL S-920]|uniref:phosphopantetheine-binding protein n=1 Tax=Streptomyces sp. NRRL S-920 TaxID=1463921 RepID=UPI001F28265A|nr:phosphopantetheine-binding protein [Streptomyces sp. NRRL S-920]
MDERPAVDTVSARTTLGMSTAYLAPRTPTEQRLAALWSACLEVAPIGVADDFFELGGDSLLAAELQLAIDQEFGVEVPAAALFLTPTVAALAQALAAAAEEAQAARPAAPREPMP